VITDGQISVRFSKTHVGHGRDLCHILISSSKNQRVPKRDVLNDVPDSYAGGECERVHLLTRKDIHGYNIAQEYNIEDYRRDKSDGVSVSIIFDERRSSVLYYKPQDTVDESQPFLKDKNFVLIKMNDAQAELLKEFDNNIIAVDGTHGAGYDLHSVIILDELHQGFPIASMISYRKDGEIPTMFYLNDETKGSRNIGAEVFMSDMVEELYTASTSVFGPPKRRLFCSWHVMKAWKYNLKTKITSTIKREET